MFYPKRIAWIILFLLSLLSSMTAMGYTDTEIDQMIGDLKKENQALKSEIRQLKDEPGPQTPTNDSPTASNPKTTSDTLMKTLASQIDRFEIHGFLSAGYSQSSRNISDQNIRFSDNGSFDSDSTIGLQTTFRINATTDVTAQLVAKGTDNWDLEAEWAFIRYSPNDELSLRAGRLRLPLYLFSESLEVGFSYPWIRPPEEVYAIPINNYDGVDAIYTLTFGDWVHSVQVFVGNENDNTFETQIFYGGNITSSLGPLLFRVSAYTFELEFLKTELPIDLSGIKNGGDYYTMASLYDDGNWMFIAEFSIFKADKPELFRDTNAAYATLGKRFGKFLPHFTVATAATNNQPPNPVPIPGVADPSNFTGDSYTLGLRYDLSANASAKIEWNHYYNLDHTGGIWSNLRYNNLLAPEANGVDDIDVIAIVIDAVF